MRTEGGAKLYAVFIDVFSSTLPDNEIDGQIMIMSEKDVKEIVKPLGQVKRIIRLQSSLKDETLQAPDQGSNVYMYNSQLLCNFISTFYSNSESYCMHTTYTDVPNPSFKLNSFNIHNSFIIPSPQPSLF